MPDGLAESGRISATFGPVLTGLKVYLWPFMSLGPERRRRGVVEKIDRFRVGEGLVWDGLLVFCL